MYVTSKVTPLPNIPYNLASGVRGIRKDAKYSRKSHSAEDGAIIPTYPSGRTTTKVTPFVSIPNLS